MKLHNSVCLFKVSTVLERKNELNCAGRGSYEFNQEDGGENPNDITPRIINISVVNIYQ